jgi:hypothetical protein
MVNTRGISKVYLSVVLLVNLSNATLFVEHPQVAMKVPVVVGKPSTPTPEGVYLVEKAYSTKLATNMLIFKRDANSVWAIHPNLKHRTKQLESETPGDNELSGGCIGISQEKFDKLWAIKQQMVLQVY